MEGLKEYLENGKSWGVGGSYVKFPPWWGYGYFLEPHIKEQVIFMCGMLVSVHGLKNEVYSCVARRLRDCGTAGLQEQLFK